MLANPRLQNETGVYSGEATIQEYTVYMYTASRKMVGEGEAKNTS
jgi:hypothetical protein